MFYIRKRDNSMVAFDRGRIETAIACAKEEVHDTMSDREIGQMSERIEGIINTRKTMNIEQVQNIVEETLMLTGHIKTAKAYILYRSRRSQQRKLRVRKKFGHMSTTTDRALMVSGPSKDTYEAFDRDKIAKALNKEAGIPMSKAKKIAKKVETRLQMSGIDSIDTSLVRELVNNELFDSGMTCLRRKQENLGMPKFDIEQLIFSKSNENSNIGSNNPEAVNLTIAEDVLKQYALSEVFSQDVADAHLEGRIHIHDLGYPTRVYCSSHSLEYLKKYGLRLGNLDTESGPAKSARVLTAQLNTYLASMQAYYAGALGLGYINIMYAPYLEGISEKELYQEAQHLIFSGSQNAFSRGGQTLFLDFNIHTGVPAYMRDVQAIGANGEYTGKTYADYEDIAIAFARQLLKVWKKGDVNGRIFAFPKCDLHVTEETFSEDNQKALFDYACDVASHNGSPYFVFDRDEVTLSACCRLRTTIEDKTMLEQPERMRFCGFQNVTLNLPQSAYRSTSIETFLTDVEQQMNTAMKAHLQKKAFIGKLMASPEMPLWEIGKTALDGEPYVDLEKATYIMGIIGLNEALQVLFGKELHESQKAVKDGLKVVAHMNMKAKELGQKHGLKVTLEESPAESASRRLAKVDLTRYGDRARRVIKGNISDDTAYYTNSIHIRADADDDIVTRIKTQSKFHSLIDSGAIIHAFVGENRPHAAAISNLVRKTYLQTNAAQLTISPEFTYCKQCKKNFAGLHPSCPSCKSTNVDGITRIVGYYSSVANWNKSKKAELNDRQAGEYRIGA